MMKKLGFSVIAAVLACGIAAAQDIEKKTTTKVSVEDGKDVKVTGCVQRGSEGGYMLTNVADKEGRLSSYILASNDDDLAEHVGHRVEISGKAADQGNGKIKVETKSQVKTGDDDKAKTTSKSEVKGDLSGLPFLGVKSIRMIAAACP